MTILQIPIPKGKGKIEVDTDVIPDEMYQLVMLEGFKAILNGKGMSKITGLSKMEGAELEKAHAAAMAQANENWEALKAGTIAKRSASTTKLPAAVRAEAMRLARLVIRDEIRAAGMIPSRVEAKVITEAAKALVDEDNSEYVKQARANLETKVKPTTHVDLSALGVTESPKLVAKAEKAKAERKTEVSAKQAGKVAPRKAQAIPHASV